MRSLIIFFALSIFIVSIAAAQPVYTVTQKIDPSQKGSMTATVVNEMLSVGDFTKQASLAPDFEYNGSEMTFTVVNKMLPDGDIMMVSESWISTSGNGESFSSISHEAGGQSVGVDYVGKTPVAVEFASEYDGADLKVTKKTVTSDVVSKPAEPMVMNKTPSLPTANYGWQIPDIWKLIYRIWPQ